MTVKELIKKLQEYPETDEVFVTGTHYSVSVAPLESVEKVTDDTCNVSIGIWLAGDIHQSM